MEGVQLGDGSREASGSYTWPVFALDVGENGVRETRSGAVAVDRLRGLGFGEVGDKASGQTW